MNWVYDGPIFKLIPIYKCFFLNFRLDGLSDCLFAMVKKKSEELVIEGGPSAHFLPYLRRKFKVDLRRFHITCDETGPTSH